MEAMSPTWGSRGAQVNAVFVGGRAMKTQGSKTVLQRANLPCCDSAKDKEGGGGGGGGQCGLSATMQ